MQWLIEDKRLSVHFSKPYLESEDCLQTVVQFFTVYILLFCQIHLSFLHQKDLMNKPTAEHLLVANSIYPSRGRGYTKMSSKKPATSPLSDSDMTDSSDLMIKQTHYVFKYITVATWTCWCLLHWMTVLPHSLLSFQLIPFFAMKASPAVCEKTYWDLILPALLVYSTYELLHPQND